MPSATMRAAVLTAPGIENLHVTDLPVPSPEPGQVRIRVMAFGLNRSEYHSVTGQAGGMTYPRVLGIEAVGVIDLDPENVLAAGTQVATMMGGMGRAFDGGYAQYVVVPREQVIPLLLGAAVGDHRRGPRDRADGARLADDRPGPEAGAVPARARRDLRARPGDRGARGGPGLPGPGHLATPGGGRSPRLAWSGGPARRRRGRRPGPRPSPRRRGRGPGTRRRPTLRDSLAATAVHGTVCFTGMLSDSWTIPDFYPMDWIPNGVGLTTYAGEARDLPAAELQRVLDRIAAGALDLVPVHSYPLEGIVDAQRDMAAGGRVGKLVGLPWD